jgi:hypothetical protein
MCGVAAMVCDQRRMAVRKSLQGFRRGLTSRLSRRKRTTLSARACHLDADYAGSAAGFPFQTVIGNGGKQPTCDLGNRGQAVGRIVPGRPTSVRSSADGSGEAMCAGSSFIPGIGLPAQDAAKRPTSDYSARPMKGRIVIQSLVLAPAAVGASDRGRAFLRVVALPPLTLP